MSQAAVGVDRNVLVRSFVLLGLAAANVSCGGPREAASAVESLTINATVVADTRVNRSEPQTNYATDTRILMQGGPEFGGYQSAAVMRFADPELDAAAIITNARLVLPYDACPADRIIEARRLPVAFAEATANQDCAVDANAAASGCGASGVEWPGDDPDLVFENYPLVGQATCIGGTISIDVTGDIEEWRRAGGPHDGWVIGIVRGTARIHSKDHATVQPRVEITYLDAGQTFIPDEPEAPPLDRAAVSNTYDSYRFIFDPTAVPSGAQNVQVAVLPGNITRDRAAHLRGTVVDGTGAPLGGVSVEVRGQPRIGRSYTRESGVFDLVMNGGGPVTLVFRAPGYLDVHRNIQAAWNDDVGVPDVVMTSEPTRCSDYISGGGGGMLTGTHACTGPLCSTAATNGWTTSDGRGDRSFGLYLPPQVVPMDGEAAVGGWRLCLTEYTRDVPGTDRENAMPADIATNTAYTFAAEGRIRRATSTADFGTVVEGAEFSDEAFFYVRTSEWTGGGEDLNFDVGTIIPSGTFDRDLSAWVPSRDGVVIDVECSGGVLTATLPSDIVLPAPEASALCSSSLVTDGGHTRLWRVPLRHFSPVDCNLAEISPEAAAASLAPSGGSGDESDNCERGSVIHCEGRSVSESVPLTGVGASLVYHSAHHAGRGELYSLTIAPGNAANAVFAGMTARVRVLVGGRDITAPLEFDGAQLAAGETRVVRWDGLDAFERRVQGPKLAQVQIRYTQSIPFCVNSATRLDEELGVRFGAEQVEADCTAGMGRRSWTRVYSALVGTVDDGQRGLGGWPVEVVHTYDPSSRFLYYGSGRRRSVDSTGMIVRTVANLGSPDANVEVGGVAVDAAGNAFVSVREGNDGAGYLAQPWEGIYRIDYSTGATEQIIVDLTDPHDVAVDREGRLWVAAGAQGCVRRYAEEASGSWSGTTVMGQCSSSTEMFPPLPRGGVPLYGVLDANELAPGSLTELAVLADGAVYASYGSEVFRWRPAGSIGLVDFRSLLELYGFNAIGMAPTREGHLLFDGLEGVGDSDRVVRRLDDGGAWSREVGALGAFATTTDFIDQREVRLEYGTGGGTASAFLLANGVSSDPLGRHYVGQQWVKSSELGSSVEPWARILRVRDGISETIAGPPSGEDSLDPMEDDLCTLTFGPFAGNRPLSARSVLFPNIRALAARPDGAVVAATNCGGGRIAVFAVQPPFEGSLSAPHVIASEDRSEVYEFDDAGRHLRTRDPISGHTLWSFQYDALGRLVRMTDREGQPTIIEHDPSEIRVRAPGALVTTLTLDANGYATAIAGPPAGSGGLAQQIWTVGYETPGDLRGLMSSFRDPEDVDEHVFTYEPDGSGRLATDSDVADLVGGSPPTQELGEAFVELSSVIQGTTLDAVRQVTLTSALGRDRHYAMRREGAQVWTRQEMPSGAFSERLDLGLSLGRAEVRLFDGSRTATEMQRDPVYDLDAAYVSRFLYCRPQGSTELGSCFDADPSERLEVARSRTVSSEGTLIDIVRHAGDEWTTVHQPALRRVEVNGPGPRDAAMSYDQRGRVRRIERSGQWPVCISYTGHRISAIRQGDYDADCNGTPTQRRVVTMEWDTTGRRWLEGVTTGHGSSAMTTDVTPDPSRGLPTQVLLPGRSTPMVLGYDRRDQLTRLLPAGHDASDDYVYTYTQRGRFLSESTPDSLQLGSILYPRSPAETSSTTYSDDRELISRSERNVQRVSFVRAPATGHVTSVSAGAESFTITPDELGRPTSISQSGPSGTGTYAFVYRGPVPVAEGVGVPGYTATLARDVSRTTGRLDSWVVTDDFDTATTIPQTIRPSAAVGEPFFYTSANRGGTDSLGFRLITTSPPAPANDLFHNLFVAEVGATADPQGPAIFRSNHEVDAFGELRQLTSGTVGSGAGGLGDIYFRSVICERDNNGRIRRRLDNYRDGAAIASLRTTYTYDAAGRLSGVTTRRHPTEIGCATTSGGSAVAGGALIATYSDSGNRVFTGSSYNDDDQLLTGTSGGLDYEYRYDDRGRLTRRRQPGGGAPATVHYRWGNLHRLRETETGGTTRTYQHDLFGRLVSIRGGASVGDPDQYFVYRDQIEPIAWARGNVHQYYVYGSQPHVPDMIYEDNDTDPEIDAAYRVISDERGSVRMVVRVDAGAPTVVQRIEYDPFGQPTYAVGNATVQPFGFAGATWLGHPGLWHMGAREYDPRAGRWISKDPIRFAGGTGLYVYAENDPVNRIDMTGRIAPLIVLAVAGALFGGALTAVQSALQNCGRIDGSDLLVGALAGAGAGFAIPMMGSIFGGAGLGASLTLGGESVGVVPAIGALWTAGSLGGIRGAFAASLNDARPETCDEECGGFNYRLEW